MTKRNLIAIPVFNEQRYVDRVLAEVRRHHCDILVVDDGSTDSTPELLARHSDIHVLTHLENRGYGMSLSSAFSYARRRGYDWVVTMDCDEQHEPALIPIFLEEAERTQADVISGTRYPAGHDATDGSVPADRRRINRDITEMINARLDLNITDAFCGFKAYKVSSLKHFSITVPGYAMPMQFWVQLAGAGLTVRELEVRLIYNDPTRHFGGLLDNPIARRQHYLDVFAKAFAKMHPAPTRADGRPLQCGPSSPCKPSTPCRPSSPYSPGR